MVLLTAPRRWFAIQNNCIQTTAPSSEIGLPPIQCSEPSGGPTRNGGDNAKRAGRGRAGPLAVAQCRANYSGDCRGSVMTAGGGDNCRGRQTKYE